MNAKKNAIPNRMYMTIFTVPYVYTMCTAYTLEIYKTVRI